MEIRDQNLSVFYMNRIFGLAPFELIRNPKGVLVGFRTGRIWYGYSVALITISGMFWSNKFHLTNRPSTHHKDHQLNHFKCAPPIQLYGFGVGTIPILWQGTIYADTQ